MSSSNHPFSFATCYSFTEGNHCISTFWVYLIRYVPPIQSYKLGRFIQSPKTSGDAILTGYHIIDIILVARGYSYHWYSEWYHHYTSLHIIGIHNIPRTCICFLLTLSLSLFYFSLFHSSLPISVFHLHIVGSLTSKLSLITISTDLKFYWSCFTLTCWNIPEMLSHLGGFWWEVYTLSSSPIRTSLSPRVLRKVSDSVPWFIGVRSEGVGSMSSGQYASGTFPWKKSVELLRYNCDNNLGIDNKCFGKWV